MPVFELSKGWLGTFRLRFPRVNFKEDSRMKKKLVALLLCFAMLMSALLTGCSTKKTSEEEEGADRETNSVRNAMTFVWALVCEELPSVETQKAVEEAVNKITKSKYTTKIVLEYYTSDTYASVVEEKLALNQEEVERAEKARKQWKNFIKKNKTATAEDGSTYKVETELLYEMFWAEYPEYEKYVQPEETTGEDAVTTEAETETNKNGIAVLAYPPAEENQLDILYISGYDNYSMYIENEWLSEIGGQISAGSKILKDYIFPAFITAAKVPEGTYAIPNNTTIGDYTYLLLNKEMMNKYYYSEGSITSLTGSLCQNFLQDIASYESDNFVPLLDNEATHTVQNVKYWNVSYTVDEDGETVLSQSLNSNKYSILASPYDKNFTQSPDGNSAYQCMSAVSMAGFTEQKKVIKGYECDGYYGAGADETRPFAAGVVVGDAADLIGMYGDEYHMVVIDYPHGTEAELYANMWAISAHCKNVTRAMEILTYLNTNEEFRNLIQYGVEGKHYELLTVSESGEELTEEDIQNGNVKVVKVVQPNGLYKMDIYKTGNVFLAYPEVGMPLNAWDYGKLQNQDALIDRLVGFTLGGTTETLNLKGMQAIQMWTERTERDLEACEDVEDLTLYFQGFTLEAGTEWSSLSYAQKALCEYNGITEANWDQKTKSVKGIVQLVNQDENISIMTKKDYSVKDDYNAKDPTAGTNGEHYGPGAGLYAVYIEWATERKFYKESVGD